MSGKCAVEYKLWVGLDNLLLTLQKKKQKVSMFIHTKDSEMIKHVIQLSLNYLSKNEDTYGIT